MATLAGARVTGKPALFAHAAVGVGTCTLWTIGNCRSDTRFRDSRIGTRSDRSIVLPRQFSYSLALLPLRHDRLFGRESFAVHHPLAWSAAPSIRFLFIGSQPHSLMQLPRGRSTTFAVTRSRRDFHPQVRRCWAHEKGPGQILTLRKVLRKSTAILKVSIEIYRIRESAKV